MTTERSSFSMSDIVRDDCPPCEPPDLWSSEPVDLMQMMKNAYRKMEEHEARPLAKIVHPAEMCQECRKRAVDHSVEKANAHVHSIPGWWE